MNLSELSIEQLAGLRDDVVSMLGERIRERQRELKTEIDRIGCLTLSEKAKPSTPRPAKPKYQKGNESWSGRGTQPGWVKQHLALGGSLDELKVPL